MNKTGFDKWVESYEREYARNITRDTDRLTGTSGLMTIDDGKGDAILSYSGYDEKTLRLYIAYQNEKTTKNLVWATWILVIATIILSILTLFLN
jgi:hypothetical protein